METVKILDQPSAIIWEYDEEADVLCLSVDAPRPALGVDIGDGPVLRDDEARREGAGPTVIALRERLALGLAAAH